MAGLFTIETVDPHVVYALLDDRLEFENNRMHCFSRLPMRQLLRFVPSHRGPMWWISEQEQEQSVAPTPDALLSALQQDMPSENEVVVVESLDWFVTKSGEDEVLNMLQNCDAIARNQGFTIVFPVEPLSFETRFWTRLRSLAPMLSIPKDEPNNVGTSAEEEEEKTQEVASSQVDEHQLVHLVSLPQSGFNTTILAKRMLQWKRMGFDLAELEPATLMQDVTVAYALYALIEDKIRSSVDAMRLIDAHQEKLTVTETERYRYRLMNLHDITRTVEEIENLISSR